MGKMSMFSAERIGQLCLGAALIAFATVLVTQHHASQRAALAIPTQADSAIVAKIQQSHPDTTTSLPSPKRHKERHQSKQKTPQIQPITRNHLDE